MSRSSTFRTRLRLGEPLIGTFLKTPSMVIAEVLGLSQLDVVCIDAEHAPFGRVEMDQCLAALRAADMPSLVRVASDSHSDIRNALDSGATGILVPHVTSAKQARAIVKAAHFGDGGRGYAGSPRAAGYGTKALQAHREDSASETTVVLQIEDIAALSGVSEIAAAGADALFVGRIDLAVAMDKPVSDAAILSAVSDVCATAREAGSAVGMFTPDLSELPSWSKQGASFYLLGSDHSFLLAGANSLSEAPR